MLSAKVESVAPTGGAEWLKERPKEMTEESGWNQAEADPTIQSGNLDEWKEVEAEKQIQFEVRGDGFIGRFMGMDPPNATGIIQSHWEDVFDLEGGYMMDSAFLNLTRDLIQKLKKVPAKAMVRIQWTDNLNTGHSSGVPMRIHDVRWKM